MEITPEKVIGSIGFIVTVLSGLGGLHLHKKSKARRAARSMRKVSPPSIEISELRDAFLRHQEEDTRAHQELGRIQQSLVDIREQMRTALKHVEDAGEGYQRLSKVETAIEELRRVTDALAARIEREHSLLGDVKKEENLTQQRLAILEERTGVRTKYGRPRE